MSTVARIRNVKPTLVVAVLLALALLCVNCRYFYPFIADDTFISLRYSERFLHGKGLTWDDAPSGHVEGYSNLSWVLACAALGLLHIDLVSAARLIGVSSSVVAIIGLAWLFGRRNRVAGVAAAASYAMAGPVGAWSVGGLEATLVAALLIWGLAFLFEDVIQPKEIAWRAVLKPCILLGLLVWSRPDGALFPVVASVAALSARRHLHGKQGRRTARYVLTIAAVAVALFALQVAFRWVYYGDVVPNTAHVKLGTTTMRRLGGLQYNKEGFFGSFPSLAILSLLALTASSMNRRARTTLIVVVPMMLLWCGYLFMIGGDILPAHRHHIPTIAFLALIVGQGIAVVEERTSNTLVTGALSGATLAMAGGLYATERTETNLLNAVNERWEHTCARIATGFAQAFSAGKVQPLIAVDPAGCLPYFSKLPSIDMLGLNDRYIATHSKTDAGHATVGHGLGDGAYVYARRPDLLVFCGVHGMRRGCFPSGMELDGAATFRANYRFVTFNVADVSVGYYVGLHSTIFGIHQASEGLIIPGVLFAEGSGPRVQVSADGIGPIVLPEHPARAERIPLAKGKWQAWVDAGAPTHGLAIFHLGERFLQGEDGALDIPSDGEYDLEIRSATRALLRRVVLTKLGS